MKTARRKTIIRTQRRVRISACLVALVFVAASTTVAQPIVTPSGDRKPTGPHTRVDLGNGKFKKVYRSEKGLPIEEVYETTGTAIRFEHLVELRYVRSVYPDDVPAETDIYTFAERPETLGPTLATVTKITYNRAGEPIEKIQRPLDCNGAPSTTVQIITTWAAGTQVPTVRVQQWNSSTKSWTDLPGQPKPPTNTGPGPTSSNTNPALPSRTTATAQTRIRPNGDDSLLISLTSPQTFDSLQITLPNSKPFSIGSLPQNWTMKQDGKRLVFSGSGTDAINIRLDAPRGGETIPDKPIEIEPGYRLKRLFRIAATARSLPPVTNVGDLTSALNLPPEIIPGQPFLATPKPGFTAGTWRIANGPVGQWINTGDPTYRPLVFKVAEDESPRPQNRVFYRYQYYDQFNELLLDAQAPDLTKPIKERNISEGAVMDMQIAMIKKMTGDRFAFAGQSTCARGNFPKWEDSFFFTLDGTTPLLPMSASPTTITFAIPPTVTPGPHNIGPACSTSSQLPINILGVEGSIDSNALLRGESTTMRLRVIGTDESLPIAITNNTPAIINIDGGVQQTVNSSGGSTNLVTRSVKGTMRGNFQIDYRLDYPVCGGGGNARGPEKKTP
jgi:hypothetical protein